MGQNDRIELMDQRGFSFEEMVKYSGVTLVNENVYFTKIIVLKWGIIFLKKMHFKMD